MAGEAADGAFLDRHQHLMLARQAADHVLVERLGKARVGDRGREAGSLQIFRRQQTVCQTRAEGEECHLGAFLDDAALADFKN